MTTTSSVPSCPPRPHGVSAPPQTPRRILVADDDPASRWLTATALRCDGYEVVEVPDGGRMLVQMARAFRSHGTIGKWDLVIANIRMPVCDGIELLEAMRKAGWQTPCVLVGRSIDSATRDHARSLGAEVFERPFDIALLRAAVRRVLR